MRAAGLTIISILLCGMAGCSRSHKSGSSISAQDIAKALPEFAFAPPPGSTNVYLERVSQPPITSAYFKLTVPRASLTNFLAASGLTGEFMPMPAQAFPRPTLPLPAGLDSRSALTWLSDARHATSWDLGKTKGPLRMMVVTMAAKASPAEQVFVSVFVDDSTSGQAPIYFEYHRFPKRR